LLFTKENQYDQSSNLNKYFNLNKNIFENKETLTEIVLQDASVLKCTKIDNKKVYDKNFLENEIQKKIYKRGKWTNAEDQLLLNLIKNYGFNWNIIKSNFKTRSLTQIKQRFINNLNPQINRRKFSNEEDKKLELLFTLFGTNWKKISTFFDNRPPNLIKNKFYIKNRAISRSKKLVIFFIKF